MLDAAELESQVFSWSCLFLVLSFLGPCPEPLRRIESPLLVVLAERGDRDYPRNSEPSSVIIRGLRFHSVLRPRIRFGCLGIQDSSTARQLRKEEVEVNNLNA